jgi:hypothetical protein
MTSTQPPPTDGDAPDVDSDADADIGRARQPNYLVRRGIAVGGVVAAIAGGAILVGSLIGGDDGAPSNGAADVEWNTIVLLDERSGQLIVANEAGEELERFASGVSRPTDAMAIGSAVMATSAEAAAVVDLRDESSQGIEGDFGSTGVVMPAGTASTMLTATADASRAVIAHGPSGDVLDTETFAPIAGARYDVGTAIAAPAGRDVLVTDSGNFQTVLLSFDRDAPSYFPGRALAVGDDLVVTTQNVGSEANITVFDHDGTSVTDARAPSVRAGMITGGDVLLVTVDGEILELTVSNGTTSAIDSLAIGTVETGFVTPGGDRLVVVGSTGTSIVDADGSVLATFPSAAPLDVGIDELAPRTSTCLAVTSDSGDVVIATLRDGTILAEAVAEAPVFPSVDGCTVVGSSDSALQVITGDGLVEQPTDGTLVGLAPDGSSVVTESDSGRLLLVELIDDVVSSDAIDLGPASRLVLFTQR